MITRASITELDALPNRGWDPIYAPAFTTRGLTPAHPAYQLL
jgi:hypothetical protein